MIATKRTNSISEAKKLKVSNFEVINVLTWHSKESRYADLCPYALKRDGVIFENFWQSTKVFEKVYPITVKPNHMSKIIWWKYEREEVHLINESIQPEYYSWAKSIQKCPNPIRYPNGKQRTKLTKFCLFNNERLNYIDSRIRIYAKEYINLIRQMPSYWELVEKLRRGVNLCITEVDVPDTTKPYPFNQVNEEGLFFPNEVNLLEMIHSPISQFGHGLCLCIALILDI